MENEGENTVCRLCLISCNFEAVGEDVIIEILRSLGLELESNYRGKLVLCRACAESARKCIDFKTVCLYTEDSINSFRSNENNVKLDLREIYLRKNENGIVSASECHAICRICMEVAESGYYMALNDEAKNIISAKTILGECFSEIDLDITENPIICTSCNKSLHSYFSFIKKCLDVADKVKKYCKTDGSSNTPQVESNYVPLIKTKNKSNYKCDYAGSDIQKNGSDNELHDEYKLKFEDLVQSGPQELPIKHEFNENEEVDDNEAGKLSSSLQFTATNMLYCDNSYTDINIVKKCQENKENGETGLKCKSFVEAESKEFNVKHEEINIKTEDEDTTRFQDDALIPNNASAITTYQCGICIFKTRNNSDLIQHMSIHKGTSEVSALSCGICSFTTKYKRNLNLHMLSHKIASEVTMYSCGICAYKAKSKGNLTQHALIHKGVSEVTTYSCKICTYQTKRKNNLNVHMLIHKNASEVATYSCEINSVQSLLTQPFCSRCSTEKAEIKRLGRPTPKLKIVQAVSSKSRSFNRNFNPEIYKKYMWICGCNVKNALFCFPCLLFGGEDSWTKTGFNDLNHLGDRIKKHALSAKHIRNILQFSLFGTINIATQLDSAYRRNIELYNEKVRHNRYILNTIINCVRFCGAFELAMRGHDDSTSSSNPGVFRGLINFSSELDVALKGHLEKASVFKGTPKTIQNEILETMFSVCQEEISKEIKEANYLSVIADETSDVSNVFQMAIVFRYLAKGYPVERFWNFLNPPDYDAKSLSSVILTELEKHVKDNTSKLIAQTYDGAAVMSGSSNGVQAIIKQTYEHAAYVHCYAHRLHLVMLNAASVNRNVRVFFANLQGICTFFSNSPQRTAVLDEIVKKRLPHSAPTRWDFNSRVICTVAEHKENIIKTMNKIQNENRNMNTINQASGYIKILKSKSFVSWLNLFYRIMPHIDLLFAKFQTREIDPIIANKNILSFENELAKIRNTSSELEEADDNKPSTSKRQKTNNWGEFDREAKEICDIIICQIRERFNFTGHLLAATLFFSEKYFQYTKCFPEKNFQETIKIYPFFNAQKLRTELSVIYETEEFRSISGLLALHDCFSQNSLLSETFSEVLKLLKILITIPMPSSEAERCFPTLKRIKTFLRNTMGQESLSALAMLSKERDLIENIPDFNQRVIDKFSVANAHRMDFLFQ